MNIWLTIAYLVYFLLFFTISFKNIKWGVFWIIFTLPIYLLRFKILVLPTTVLEIQILVLFLVWIIQTLKHKNIKTLKQIFQQNKFFLFPFFFFIVASIISIFVSPNLREALGIWKAYFLEPVLFLMIFISVIKKPDLENVFKWLSASVFLLSCVAIYQKITGNFISNEFWSAEATRRVTSVFPYPNALALYLTPIIVLLLGNIVKKIKDSFGNCKLEIGNYLEIVSCILGFVAVYFTKSKGALLALLVGIIFYAIFYKGYRKIFTVILSIAIIVSIIFIAINPELIKGVATVEGGDSISTRLDMWNETWQMLKAKPILGAGLAGYQTAVAPFHTKDYIEIYLYPHNIIFNFWSEIGLLGLLAFVGLLIWFFRQKNSSIIFKASTVALLAHGLVDVPYFKNDLAVLFWLIMGLVLVFNNNQTKFILIGGRIYNAPDGGKSFCHELAREINNNKKPIKILDVLFARPTDSWEERFKNDKKFFEKNLTNFEIELADTKNFLEQIKNSDIIFFQGGNPKELIKTLNSIGKWFEIIKGKTIVGSSGGADIFCRYYGVGKSMKIYSGLNFLPIKFIPHWKEKKNYSTQAEVDWELLLKKIKSHKEKLEVIVLKEGEYITIDK